MMNAESLSYFRHVHAILVSGVLSHY